MDFPIIQNDRIILKQIENSDINDVYKHFSNDEVNKYVDFDSTKSIDEAKEIVDWGNNLFKQMDGILWGIYRKSDNKFMGQLNYVQKADANFLQKIHRAEIGFDLTPQFWGNGYMFEAIQLGNIYIFNEMKMHRIEAITHHLNSKAHKVLEKTGFLKEGILKEYVSYHDKYFDMVIFSLIKNN